MEGKRKPSDKPTAKRAKYQQQSGPSGYKSKQLTRESFMKAIKDIEMYTDKDSYYEKAKINVGPLELDWS